MMPETLINIEFGGEDVVLAEETASESYKAFCEACGHPEYYDAEEWDGRIPQYAKRYWKIRDDSDGTALYDISDGYPGCTCCQWFNEPVDGICEPASKVLDEDPLIGEYSDRMYDAKNLDELADVIRQLSEEPKEFLEKIQGRFDYQDLPTFSDNEPADLESVWSWDEKRLLVGSDIPFQIISRYDVEE